MPRCIWSGKIGHIKLIRNFSVSNEAEKMAARMLELQNLYEQTLPANQPYAIRLDGVAFRNYTSGMLKPFDFRLTRSLILTTRDLMERCSARTGFCQSDEITLVFAGEPSPFQIMYSGRVQKIVSVMAAMAAARFNWHIQRNNWNDPPVDDKTKGKIENATAYFDARAFSTVDDIMASEAIYWRHAFDGRRNAINMIGCQFLKPKQMHGLALNDLLSTLQKEYSIDPFTKYPPSTIYGTFLKKKQVPHMGFNPITGLAIPTIRSRIEARSFDWKFPERERAQMVMAKFWEPEHPASLEVIEL